MEGSELLALVGEIGIGLAGFTGIVAVLGPRALHEWKREDRFKLWLMIEFSFAAMFFAVVPLVITYLGAAEATAWRMSSALMVAFFIGHLAVFSPKIMVYQRQGRWVSRKTAAFIITLVLVTLGLQILNSLGLLLEPSAGLYLLGLVFLVSVAAANFVILLTAVRGDA